MIEEKIRKRTAQELRENAKYPSHHRHVHDAVGYHMSRVDHGRLAEGMNAVADLLDQEAT